MRRLLAAHPTGCNLCLGTSQLGFSPARLFSLLSLLPLFLSVPSAVSVPSVLNPAFLLFLLSVNSAFSVCSVLNPSALLLSVASAFSVCSALNLFFLSRHSPLVTRLPRPGRGVFSAPSVLNPSFLLFLLSVNSAFSVCSALSLFFLSRHSPLATSSLLDTLTLLINDPDRLSSWHSL